MTQAIEAIYENGVFVPASAPALAEHERVRLLVESLSSRNPEAVDVIQRRRHNRLCIDATLAKEIADSPDFDLLESL
jgi:predicted DNA-binding antitoxin AbrB/MazE fold protein